MNETVSPSGPPSGWYQDLEDANRERWWDGTQWGVQVRDKHVAVAPPSLPVPPPAPAPLAPASYRSQAVDTSEKNGPATTSMILVIIVFALNAVAPFLFSGPVGTLVNLVSGVLGFVAIILGVIGLVIAVRRPTRKRNAIVGLVVGVLVMVWSFGQFASAMTSSMTATTVADVEQTLSALVGESLGQNVKLLCSGEQIATEGETYRCLDVGVTVEATMLNDQGALIWELVE